eukprot:Unigene4208_Nuclearia_a/m.12796 Unigene4208_Nuclearia_a/g.12796  ORF Unigene4208_Nuclearia_a/g.12796 Unigene4208_Nuclearia_a/m.12796 type:complete len:334 (+) Unigene4208_Nuclearia_a:33-1034(+)
MKSALMRELGRSKVLVNAMGLGCMGMSEFYGATDDEESLRVLHHSLDVGCTFWDTSDIYGPFKNEILLGQVLKMRRREVFLCTKFGIVRDPANPSFRAVSGKPEYVRKACEASLQRLGVDCIDLYYQHRVDKDTPIEETVGAMAELVREGKVRFLGLSECSAATLRRAHKVHPIAAVQIEYSPWSLDIEENGLLAACRELGVSIVAYSPLGRGFLTGSIKSPDDFAPDDYRRFAPRFSKENFHKNLELVDKLKELAAKKGCTVSQFVLAWVLAQGDDFIVIPGTKRMKYFDENYGALTVQLTQEDLQAVRDAVKTSNVTGERYAPAGMAIVNV